MKNSQRRSEAEAGKKVPTIAGKKLFGDFM